MFDVKAPQFPFPNVKFFATITTLDEANIRNLTEVRVKGAIKRKS